MEQYAFYFDQSRCYSCHACSVACKDWNGIEAGPEKWMSVYEWETGSFPSQRVRSLAFPCAHCDAPACMSACPEGAIFKEDTHGAVLVDSEKCTGCRSCYDACAYGAPTFANDEAGTKMSKCTMCIDKLEAGEMPVCVSSCPLRAFDFGPVEQIEAKYGTLRQLEGMPEPTSGPNFIVKASGKRKQLVTYDAERAIRLLQHKEGFADDFSGEEFSASANPELLESSELRMKHENSKDLLETLRNFAG